MESLFINLYTRSLWVTSLLRLLIKAWRSINLQTSRFPLMKFWYTIWMYRASDFQSNNIEKHPSDKYFFFFESAWVNLLLIRLITVTLSKNNHNYCRKIYRKLSKLFNVITQKKPLVLSNQNHINTIIITGIYILDI